MKYSINIDQINSLAWDLNLSEAAVFTYLFNVPTWADTVLIDGKTFYFSARQKTCQDVPLISEKPDTIYRIYKSLAEKGVIEYLKHMGKDCMRITEKGKGWNSEKNPSNTVELGKKSESTRKIFRKDSEKNPTYNSTIDYTTILLDKEEVEKEFSTVTLIDEVDETSVEIHHVPEYFETEQENPTPQVAPPPRPKAKRAKADDPTPIRAMFELYADKYAELNNGVKPEFMVKYTPAMKNLYGILRARSITAGFVPLDNMEPWRDFLTAWTDYLAKNEKEKWHRANFNPLTFFSQFNSIVAMLNNQPKTDAEKWMDFARRNGVL